MAIKINGKKYKVSEHAIKRFQQRYGKGFSAVGILRLFLFHPRLTVGYKPIFKPDRKNKGVTTLVTILFTDVPINRIIQ